MKILWVSNLIVGDLAVSKGAKLTSGQWLNAEIENEKKLSQNEIVIVTSSVCAETLVKDNIKYIVLSHGNVAHYKVCDENISEWKSLFESEKPDLILVWGTEYDIGRCALIANDKKIPSVIYIQGVMSSIAKNYRGGLSDSQIKKMTTIVEKIRHTSIFDVERIQCKKADFEGQSIGLCDGIIVENKWAQSQYLENSPDLKVYKSRLPIKTEFFDYMWRGEDFLKHTIITTAANYPLKGLHILLKALVLVKKKYPDVQLFVPGPNNIFIDGIKKNILQSGYCKYIRNYIQKNSLTDNVVFTGPLTSSAYAEYMQKCNVFVSASAVENHGSALREAMSVGVPCVSSRVGGLVEYAKHGKNCSLYDYGDVEQLAECIMELFEDKNLRAIYSEAGRATIEDMYSKNSLMTLNEIYVEALKNIEGGNYGNENRND